MATDGTQAGDPAEVLEPGDPEAYTGETEGEVVAEPAEEQVAEDDAAVGDDGEESGDGEISPEDELDVIIAEVEKEATVERKAKAAQAAAQVAAAPQVPATPAGAASVDAGPTGGGGFAQWELDHPCIQNWQEMHRVKQQHDAVLRQAAADEADGREIDAAGAKALAKYLESQHQSLWAKHQRLNPGYQAELQKRAEAAAKERVAPVVIGELRQKINTAVGNVLKAHPRLNNPGLKVAVKNIFLDGIERDPRFNPRDAAGAIDMKKQERAIVKYALENGFVTVKGARGASQPEPSLGGGSTVSGERAAPKPASEWKNPESGKAEAVLPGYTKAEYAEARSRFSRKEMIEFKKLHGRNIFD